MAVSSAVEVMKHQVPPEYCAKFWESRFPSQLPKRLMIADELQTDVIDCEGEQLIVVPLKFADAAGMASLHVPSPDLIAAGDAADNGVHPRLLELNQNQKRDEWLAALDKLQSLKPRIVVAGHKNPKNDDDGSRVIRQTRQYILDFQKVAEETTSRKELCDQMLARRNSVFRWFHAWAIWGNCISILSCSITLDWDRSPYSSSTFLTFAVTLSSRRRLWMAATRLPSNPAHHVT